VGRVRVDGKPYGGGPGMVMWVDPIVRAVTSIQKKLARRKNTKVKVVIFSPGGKQFTNILAKQAASKYTDIIFICGRYEGIDERVKKIFKAELWSVGPYVLTGGELPAMLCVDAISRHIEGVLHASDSIEESRISSHEVYARPEVYEHNGKSYKVPKVLLSGNHKEIDAWREKRGNKHME
jgi:tRNA (guanine37-N1)-methyltransferase